MFSGIDVSKATLDVVFVTAPNAKTKPRHRVFQNTSNRHQELIGWLQKQRHNAAIALGPDAGGPDAGGPDAGAMPVHVCLEATGTYGDAVARALHEAGHLVSVVNPAAIRAFAKSRLTRHKTDQADAQLIARFCALHQTAPWSPPAPEYEQLQAMMRRLENLQEMKQMEHNQLLVTSDMAVRASSENHIAYLEQQIKATQKQVKAHIESHPTLREQNTLLLSIHGIAWKTAALLLAALGSIEAFDNASQVAAFAGLAPCERESGASVRGKPRLSKVGSARLRKAIFYPAMTALRYNPSVLALGARLTVAGKCKRVLLGAAMHKLLVLAYGVLKSGQPFDPNFCLQKA